jgi:hypothetical protein
MDPNSKSPSQPRRGEQRDLHFLKIYEHLPPSAVLPVSVAAAVKGVSDKTIRRNYTLTAVSGGRVGVRKELLEADQTPSAA